MNKKGKPLSLFGALGNGTPFIRYIAGLADCALFIANSYGRRAIQQPTKNGLSLYQPQHYD